MACMVGSWKEKERGFFDSIFSPSNRKKPSGTQGTNLLSEKRFAHRRKRGYIKVNALKVQQLNSLKLPNKQTSKKKNLSSHSSPNPPSHVIQLTISDDLRRRSSMDSRRTPSGPLLSPGFSHNAESRWRRMCESVNPPDRPFLGCIFPRVIWSRRKYLVT